MDVISAYWIYCLTFSHVSVSVLGLLHADGRFSQINPFVTIYTRTTFMIRSISTTEFLLAQIPTFYPKFK